MAAPAPSRAVTLRTISAKETYPLRHTVLWPNLPLSAQGLAEDDLPNVTHHGAFVGDGDKLVSIVTFVKGASDVQFRKFATDPAYRSRGIGTALLKHGIAAALRDADADADAGRGAGAEKLLVWCHARTAALAFYERLGLVPLLPEHRYSKEGEGGKPIEYIRIGGVFTAKDV